MATTPPPMTIVRTPSTPLHGARYDSNHLRKSTRQTSSRIKRAVETPPPRSIEDSQDSSLLSSKKASILRSAAHTYSPPSSTHTSPRKKVRKGRKVRSSNYTSIADDAGSSSEAPSLDQNNNTKKNPLMQRPSLTSAAGMLPTPAKTPRKKQVQPAVVNGAARVLFPVHQPDSVEDAMPTPRKRRNKRHVGFSIYSSMEDDGDASSEGKIQIYTDSKEKVPEFDPNEENPFYEKPEEHPPPPEPTKRRTSKKRKAAPNAESRQEVTETLDREEGMVYVFRGKKIFRKFPNVDEDANDDIDDTELESSRVRPLTRSSIKPRLLFPTPKQRQEREAPTIEDEEATTDLEEPHDEAEEEEQVTTPVKQTIFSPATPPTTGHATRSAKKNKTPEHVDHVPFPRGKKVSPFDGWARTKTSSSGSGGGGGKGRKREAEAMETTNHKKARGNGVV